MIEYENLQKLNRPYLDELNAGLNRVLDRGSFILGKEVEEFEKHFASYCNSKYCVGVGNGMDALTLGLRSFSFKEGSEVIVPANTYIASILSILNAGLKPVLVEPDPATCNLDPNRVEHVITGQTVAIMAVHLYGKSCAMDELTLLQKKHNLRLVEDCAQAHGARYKEKSVGAFGDFGAFSFYPTKNLGALGDGGCVVTSDEELEARVRLLRNYGSCRKDVHEVIGVNSRLDELQSAFLTIKFKYLDQLNDSRRKLASIYSRELGAQFVKPALHPDYFDVYHVYNIRHPRRDRLRDYMSERGVETLIHYPIPPYRQNALHHLFRGSFPISDEIHATTLSLPVSPIHSEEEIQEIIEIMNKF